MQSMKLSSWTLSLIVLVCWLDVNHGVPFGSHVKKKAHSSRRSNHLKSARRTMNIEQIESVIQAPRLSANITLHAPDVKQLSYNYMQSTNNITSKNDSPNHSERKLKNSDGDFNGLNVELDLKKTLDNMKNMKERHVKCPTGNRRSNQAYTRSFPENISLIDFVDVFEISSEAEARKESTVHTGEDVTICWIESTTVKEDPQFNPPKKIVIREFTISFENSAIIPDNYLECTMFDGEIGPGDEEGVCKSSLREMINQDVKKSRVANFTSTDHNGSIIISQQKVTRCATGGLIYKDIWEWPDNSNNPKKRVEIKIAPLIQPVTCKNGNVTQGSNIDSMSSSESECTSGESCETTVTCEECYESSTESYCEDGNCSNSSSDEEISITSYPSNISMLSLKEVDASTKKKLEQSLSITDSSILLPFKPDESGDVSCSEHDTDCRIGKIVIKPATNESENCSGKDCFGGSFSGFSGNDDKDVSRSCSGEECTDKEESITIEIEETTTTSKSIETCVGNSGSCDCSGSSCSTESSEKSDTLVTEIKLTDNSATSSLNMLENSGLQSTLDYHEGISSSEISTKNVQKSNGFLLTSTLQPCHSSESENCATAVPASSESLNGLMTTTEELEGSEETEGIKEMVETEGLRGTKETEESEGMEETEGSVAIKEIKGKEGTEGMEETEGMKHQYIITTNLELSKTNNSGDDRSISCEKDSTNENCKSAESASGSKSVEYNLATDSLFESSYSIQPFLPDLGKYIVPTDNATTSIINISPKLPETMEVVTPLGADSSDKKKMDLDSLESKESIVSSQSCETLGNCDSTEVILFSTQANQTMSVNYTTPIKNSEESSCDDSKNCEISSSDTSFEPCEGESSNVDCSGKRLTVQPCDSSTGSCSPQLSKSVELIDGKIKVTVGTCDSSVESCSQEVKNSETIDETINVTTDSTANELEHYSTIVDDFSTTTEARHGTTIPFLTSLLKKNQHQLALRVKVTLEHIDENKEKEQLVQFEKHVLLNERPEDHGNHSLIWHIKSLNNSINIETLKSIFDCMGLHNFTNNFTDTTELKNNQHIIMSLNNKSKDPYLENSTIEAEEEMEYHSMEKSYESSPRKKKKMLVSEDNGNKKKVTDQTKINAIRGSLSGVKKDFQSGLNHVLSRLSKEFDGSEMSESTKPTELSSPMILKILANPADRRVHSRRQKRMSETGVVSIDELEHPVKGEEIDRWSNERFVSAVGGGRVRSLLEFKIMRNPVVAS